MKELIRELNSHANPKKANLLQGFFKTGKGEYGEGDVFLGITVPILRKIVSRYWDLLSRSDIQELLDSKIHEHRLIALFILVKQYQKHPERSEEIFNFYLRNTKSINNWDLVDLSAPNIPGNYLLDKPRHILYKLANSSSLWEKRISILATFAFIRENEFSDTLKIAEILLADKHDLIHKAVGWMLREVGKRDLGIEKEFLDKHCKNMPRTMLRYAIEKFPEKLRKDYLSR